MEFHLEPQPENAAPVDEVTKTMIEEAQASARRGETVTLDQARINMRKRLQAWQKAKTEVALTA